MASSGRARQRKTKKKLAQAVSKGVAMAVGEPKMEIDAEAAGEVDADERLRPGFAQEAPPAIPLGMDRHGGAVGALLGCSVVKHSRLSSCARQNKIRRSCFCTCNRIRARRENR